MPRLKVLYVSGSLGLGHVTRDLAIACELRRRYPDADICWLAAHPATEYLTDAGETLIPESEAYANENVFAEQAARGRRLNLIRYVAKARGAWNRNVELFRRITDRVHFDLVIGDETYEIAMALGRNPTLKTFRFVMIYDFVGLDPMTANPLEWLGVYFWNSIWSSTYRRKSQPFDVALFVGEADDVPDKRFGPFLRNRRQFATAMYKFVGYIFPFDPAKFTDRAQLKRDLGYGPEPLVMVSTGGTSIGKGLLELCGQAAMIAREKIPSLRTVLVAGPRIPAGSLSIPSDVEVREFVPRLYEHFAASDLAIVQGGLTSTMELAALRRPFLYFPLEAHSEQANVARILEQRGIGVRMDFSRTTPALLAEKMALLIGGEVSHAPVRSDGARRAVEEMARFL